MKVRHAGVVLCCLATLLGMGSCSDSTAQYLVTENRNVPACGITDPLTNTDWLSAYVTKHTPTNFTGITITISVYANKITKENHYVMSYSNSEVVDYGSKEIYDCSGQKILFKAQEEPAPAGWDTFFAENDLVATIWEIKKQ
jgi:hypothetical protein